MLLFSLVSGGHILPVLAEGKINGKLIVHGDTEFLIEKIYIKHTKYCRICIRTLCIHPHLKWYFKSQLCGNCCCAFCGYTMQSCHSCFLLCEPATLWRWLPHEIYQDVFTVISPHSEQKGNKRAFPALVLVKKQSKYTRKKFSKNTSTIFSLLLALNKSKWTNLLGSSYS